MGVTEEVGKVVENVTNSFRSQPIMLGLLILHLATLTLMWIILSAVSQNRTNDIKLAYEAQRQVQDLLSRCVVQK